MIDTGSDEPTSTGETKLPRRDWILLPLLALATIGFLAGSAEFIAGRLLTHTSRSGESCMNFNDPTTGPLGIPGCTVQEKMIESRTPSDYRFNSSGFRDDENFAPKAPHAYRITMIGTSLAAGFRVPQEKAFGTRMPAELSRLTGRNVEVYDEGVPWRSPEMIAHDFDRDVLSTTPDLVLWILTPDDLRRSDSDWKWVVDDPGSTNNLSSYRKVLYYIKSAFEKRSLGEIIDHTRASKLLEIMLYRSPSLFVQSSLRKNAAETNYLKSSPPESLLQNLREFDRSAAEIEEKARKAGIPVAVAYAPDRTQAAMIAMGTWPRGYNPYMLGDELRPIVASHGWPFIDLLPDYKTIPNPQLGFYAIDGHPNVEGNAVILRFLSGGLTGGTIPSLKATAPGTMPRQLGNRE